MDAYNYLENVTASVIDFVNDRYTEKEIIELLYEDFNRENTLSDACWAEDSVTGNASGSYTFSTYQAEENLCHNWSLLQEACAEFGADMNDMDPETADVTIRLYVLGEAVSMALDQLEQEHPEPAEVEEEEEI